MTLNLPNEIWQKIFSYLEFDQLQKNAALVCKGWFDIVRNDCTLSGHVSLRDDILVSNNACTIRGLEILDEYMYPYFTLSFKIYVSKLYFDSTRWFICFRQLF